MERIEVFTSKKKSFLMLTGSLLFVVASVWMFMNADEMRRNPLYIKGVAVVGALFFSLATFITIKQLINNKLALVIDPEGLGINFRKSQIEFIDWDEITGFNEIKIKQVQIIIIMVKDPKKWLEKETGFFRKKLMQANIANYGSPFNISTVSLSIKHSILMEKLVNYRRNFSKSDT